MSQPRSVNVIELYELHSESSALQVIDVRELDEIEAVRTSFAKALPLSRLAGGDIGPLAQVDKSETLYMLCRSGNRSRTACDLLSRAGFANVVNVEGGMIAWEAARLPVLKGK